MQSRSRSRRWTPFELELCHTSVHHKKNRQPRHTDKKRQQKVVNHPTLQVQSCRFNGIHAHSSSARTYLLWVPPHLFANQRRRLTARLHQSIEKSRQPLSLWETLPVSQNYLHHQRANSTTTIAYTLVKRVYVASNHPTMLNTST